MRRAVATLSFAFVAVAAIPFVVVPTAPSKAKGEGPATFLIPAEDGYGLGDCLATGAECGRVVASAWCQAHGYKVAVSFGRSAAEDVTASVTPVAASQKPQPFSVTCAE